MLNRTMHRIAHPDDERRSSPERCVIMSESSLPSEISSNLIETPTVTVPQCQETTPGSSTCAQATSELPPGMISQIAQLDIQGGAAGSSNPVIIGSGNSQHVETHHHYHNYDRPQPGPLSSGERVVWLISQP